MISQKAPARCGATGNPSTGPCYPQNQSDRGFRSLASADVRRLDAWRWVDPKHRDVLIDRQGVTLVEYRNGIRYALTRSSVATAACAVASGYLPLRPAPGVEDESRRQRQNRRRAEGRALHG